MRSKILKLLAGLACIGTVGVAYAVCYANVNPHYFAYEGETRVLGGTYTCPSTSATGQTYSGSGTFVMVANGDCRVFDWLTATTAPGEWYNSAPRQVVCQWTFMVSCNAQTLQHEQVVNYPGIGSLDCYQ